jgi:hypothetical protein
MARRKKLQLVRPFQDEQSFIDAEGWTLKKSSVLLVDAPGLAIGTMVRCDISLESGQTLIRAEGKIVEEVAPEGGRPGGLKLRFQRVAPDTQEFINRVLSSARVEPVDSGPAASPGPLAPPDEEPASPEFAEATAGGAEPRPAGPTEPAPPEDDADSGLHARVVAPVEPPPNREELLDRLRARQRHRIEEGDAPAERPRAGEDAG